MGVVKLSTAGILDYQKYSSALAGNSPYIPFSSAFELLETEILTGTQATVTFSSLNSTYGADYQHLQIRAVVRTTKTTANRDDGLFQFNNNTGSNYARHALEGNGSAVSSFAETSQSQGFFCFPSTNHDTANIFTAVVTDILDPFETTKYTTVRSLSGRIGSSPQNINLNSSVWMNTAALTEIDLYASGGSWVSGSRFSLYGLKAA